VTHHEIILVAVLSWLAVAAFGTWVFYGRRAARARARPAWLAWRKVERQLSRRDRRLVYWAGVTGRAAPDPRLAELTAQRAEAADRMLGAQPVPSWALLLLVGLMLGDAAVEFAHRQWFLAIWLLGILVIMVKHRLVIGVNRRGLRRAVARNRL
jgi:hypothetical protein